jgi:uncharacterized protein
MSFQHGIQIQENPTSLRPPRPVDSALPFVVGTAPVQTLTGDKPINKAVLVHDLEDFVAKFGAVPADESETDYSLASFARIYFALYGSAPAIMVNVFDPAEHEGGPDDVVAADIVGGIDGATGTRTGIELVEVAFPEFGKIPAILLAPGHSHLPAVAVALAAKANLINGHFRAMALIDVPPTEERPEDAVAWKATYDDPHALVCWPRVMVGDQTHWLSAHVAGLIAQTDRGRGGIPFEGPSNKGLRITGAEHALTITQANYLNEQGLVTVLRVGTAGHKLWGNRTSAYPGSTDIKDVFVPCRRMVNFIANSLIVSTWQRVDDPLNPRLIQGIADSTNIWLNGLTGQGALLGARVEFLRSDNPLTSLIDGKVKFRIHYLPVPPMEAASFVLEVDPSYFDTLFG